MKTIIGVVLLWAAALNSRAQETKVVTKSSQNPFGQEKYSVLKADAKVKHGPYARLVGRGNALAESGYYCHGEKDSTWVEYYRGSQKVRARAWGTLGTSAAGSGRQWAVSLLLAGCSTYSRASISGSITAPCGWWAAW